MFSVQQILTLFLTLTMELGLTACGAEARGAARPGNIRTAGTGAGEHQRLHLTHRRNLRSWN